VYFTNSGENAIKDCELCTNLERTYVKAYLRKAAAFVLLKLPRKAVEAYEIVSGSFNVKLNLVLGGLEDEAPHLYNCSYIINLNITLLMNLVVQTMFLNLFSGAKT